MPIGDDSVPPPFPLIDNVWNPTIKTLQGCHRGKGRKRREGSGGPGSGISHSGHYSGLQRGWAMISEISNLCTYFRSLGVKLLQALAQ